VIKSGSPGSGGSIRAGSSLVVVEFALAMVLVAGAGVLMKSFVRLMNVDPGFNPQGLLTMRLAFPQSRKPDELFRLIEQRVKQLPGVTAFATTSALPLTPDHGNASRFNVPGSPLIHPDSLPSAQIRFVSPNYFETMRIRIRSGRAFTEQDLNRPVVIINEELARTFWPGRDPVGEKFITGPLVRNPVWSTIVGVAGDVKQFGLDSKPSLDIYYPALFPVCVVVHTAGDPRPLAGAVRSAIHGADANLPVSGVRTMDQMVAESARTRRGTMMLLAAFASLALLLALVGIYGVMSWSVAQRTREIGIRMALGATSGEVLRVVIRQGMKLSFIGIAAGLLGALATRRFLAFLVFGVSASDPLVYGAVATLMLGVGFVACYVPARRATRVDPRAALVWK
jgi:putative ABC transport system permease protein